ACRRSSSWRTPLMLTRSYSSVSVVNSPTISYSSACCSVQSAVALSFPQLQHITALFGMCLRPLLAADYWCVVPIAPLVPGGVVVLGTVVAQQSQNDRAVRGTDPCLSVDENLLLRRDPRRRQLRTHFSGRQQASGARGRLRQIEPLQVHRAGDVAAMLVLSGVLAGMLGTRAYVPDDGMVSADRLPQLIDPAEAVAAFVHLEPGALYMGLVSRNGGVLLEPLLKAAVEHLGVRMSVMVEGPPEARGVEPAHPIVGHNRLLAPDAVLGHRFRELIGAHEVSVIFALQVVVNSQPDGALDVKPLVGRKFVAVNDPDRR